MEVKLAVLADHANRSENGKLNVQGIFDAITATAFPAMHELMMLVMRFEVGAAEYGQTKQLEIVLITEDGHPVGRINGTLLLKPKASPLMQVEEILPLAKTIFPHAGNYAFVILVNGDEKGRVPLTLMKLEVTPDANSG